MTQLGGVQSWCLTATFYLILAVALHQSFATLAPPTTEPPHKEPGRPERGRYQVTRNNGSVCLLAYMGLQFNVTFTSASLNKTVQEVMNLRPNATKASGSCEAESAFLRLSVDADKTNLTLSFALNATSNKYHLSEVSLSAFWPDMKETLQAHNSTLAYLRGTLGYSYMCREEQTLDIAPTLSINTFQVQVQPFGITENQFGAAEECQLDEDDMLIPIVVGAALAGLVLIVLLAYLIGRKRSQAGYQTI